MFLPCNPRYTSPIPSLPCKPLHLASTQPPVLSTTPRLSSASRSIHNNPPELSLPCNPLELA
ncbi:hypothetical protein J6590_046502 [Homalodisca vitripennis]|nr:hypothetical protein J6590_046502 [Homalodisca vitripennis]